MLLIVTRTHHQADAFLRPLGLNPNAPGVVAVWTDSTYSVDRLRGLHLSDPCGVAVVFTGDYWDGTHWPRIYEELFLVHSRLPSSPFRPPPNAVPVPRQPVKSEPRFTGDVTS